MAADEDTGSSSRARLESLLSADLGALNAQADSIGRFFADMHGLSATEFYALLHVMVGETSGSPLTAGSLHQRMGLTNAGVTYLVRRMTAAGHIRRDTDVTDRRKAQLRYEPQGMELARSFFTRLGAANRTAMAAFSDEDLATAHRVMSTLTDSMDHFRAQLDDPRG
jgi:DNA-binding MarR family transcriptional regulator